MPYFNQVCHLSALIHQPLLWVRLPLASATLDSDGDGNEEPLSLEGLVTGMTRHINVAHNNEKKEVTKVIPANADFKYQVLSIINTCA